jgi:transposase, IS30 family
MEKAYKRISYEDRIKIEIHLKLGSRKTKIALELGFSKSAICREINRCSVGNYQSINALHSAVSNASGRKSGKTKMSQNEALKNYVKDNLEKHWSPEQIHLSLIKTYPENKQMRMSVETIYLHIYVHTKPELRAVLIEQLRHKRKYRGNAGRGKNKRTLIPNPTRIDERPEEVKGRLIPGHWEGDLIIGKDHQSAIGTLNERSSRTVIIVPLKAKDATSVRKAFEKEFKKMPKQMKKTLTYDNGSEMAQHEAFTKNTKVQVYFAHPYSPWERPTNENSNGLIRDFFPKGTDFNKVSKARIKEVQNLLNERPRKVLDMQTPKEVFDEFVLNKIEKKKTVCNQVIDEKQGVDLYTHAKLTNS